MDPPPREELPQEADNSWPVDRTHCEAADCQARTHTHGSRHRMEPCPCQAYSQPFEAVMIKLRRAGARRGPPRVGMERIAHCLGKLG